METLLLASNLTKYCKKLKENKEIKVRKNILKISTSFLALH